MGRKSHKKPGKGVKILLIILAFFLSPLAVLIMQYMGGWDLPNLLINLVLFLLLPLVGFIHGAYLIWTEKASGKKKHSHRRTGRSTGHSSRYR